jgi:uncharacterized protein DUF7024
MKMHLARRVAKHPDFTLIAVIVIGLLIYAGQYVETTSVPGNSDIYPLGWWGWFDQGEYLRASQNMFSGELLPEAQRYPPLYPLLGALFLPVSELHSYLPINIMLYVAYLWMFMAAFQPIVGRWAAAIAVIVGLYLSNILSMQWVYPWTSSLAACLQMATLLLFSRYLINRNDPSWGQRERLLNALMCGAAAGLLAPTRPVDLVAFTPLLIAYAGMVLFEGRLAWRDKLAIVGVGIAASLLPTLGYLGFNAWLFGDPMGGYFVAIEGSGGEAISDFFGRSYSHLIDAKAFYAEANADWLSRLPQMLLFLCFVPFGLLFGSPFLRVVAVLVLMHLALVYSFADAVPGGQFRYLNIHYFKWMYPVLPVFLFYFVKQIWVAFNSGSNPLQTKAGSVGLISVIGGVSLLLAAMAIRPVYETQHASSLDVVGKETLTLRFDPPVMADFFDIGMSATPIGAFGVLEQNVMVNGTELRPISDARVVPRFGGMRVILTDKMLLEDVRVSFSGLANFTQTPPFSALAAEVGFRLHFPWADEPDLPAFPTPVIVPGRVYAASDAQASDVYLADGWSQVEDWGRWMDGESAKLRFKLPSGLSADARFFLEGQGFLPGAQKEIVLDVLINGSAVGALTLPSPEEGRIEVPLPQLQQTIEVELQPSSTLSPEAAGMNSDTRQLSFGLVRFGIVP